MTTSEAKESRELKVLQALSSQPNNHPGWHYVNKMLDHFTILGPNGSHDCWVLELVGPNVADIVERHLKDSRLPSNAARLFSKQILQGLDFLSASDIGHGGKMPISYMLVSDVAKFLHRYPHEKSGFDNTRLTFT